MLLLVDHSTTQQQPTKPTTHVTHNPQHPSHHDHDTTTPPKTQQQPTKLQPTTDLATNSSLTHNHLKSTTKSYQNGLRD